MKLRAFLMLGLAAMLATASVLLAKNWLDNQAKPARASAAVPEIQMATVVVAKMPLSFGNTIRKEHLKLASWPANSLPDGSFSKIDEVVGAENGEQRVALRRIDVNEPVLQSKVSGFGGRATLSTVIAPEMRAATIRVNDVNGVAGFVLPGDRVDVMLTRGEDGTQTRGKDGKNELITDILLQNLKVLAIDQSADEEKDKPTIARAVTLEVMPEQAQKLVLAQQIGSLSLSLRNLADAAAEKAKTVSLKDLRVGEANDVVTAPPPEKKVVVVKPPVRHQLPSVRIFRGTESQTYEVQPEASYGGAAANRIQSPIQLTPRAEPSGAQQPAFPQAGDPPAKIRETDSQSRDALGPPLDLLRRGDRLTAVQ